MKKLALFVLIISGLLACSAPSTPPTASPAATHSSASPAATHSSTSRVAAPTTAASSAPASTASAAPAKPLTPAESAADFKAKVEAKCLEKHPEKGLRFKGCVALRMGTARTACQLAKKGSPKELCKEHPDLCGPEVKEFVTDGLAFCDAFMKEE